MSLLTYTPWRRKLCSFVMSMDSGKLLETAASAVSSLTRSVSHFESATNLWWEYVGVAFPSWNATLSVVLFAGQQKLTEIGTQMDATVLIVDGAEADAQQVINNEKSNLNAVGLMHGVEAARRGIEENRRAIDEISEQPAKFADLSRALEHMTTLAVGQVARNEAVIGEIRLGIDHGQKYKPII